jgi:5-methylcytosine-specific restriction endonuclease McrA
MEFKSAEEIESIKIRRKEYFRLWHIKNRDRRSHEQRLRRASNPDKYRAMSRSYQSRNLPKFAAYSRKYRSKSTSTAIIKNYNKSYYQSHRSEILSRKRIYRPEAYRRRKQAILGRNKQWRLDNPGKYKALLMKRRALKRAATVNLASIVKWLALVKSRPEAVCYWCGKIVSSSAVHFDHIIPLSKGGPHAIENLCTSCVECNLQKGNKPLRLWVRMGQQHLEL